MTASAEAYLQCANICLDLALDRIDDADRLYHPGARSHAFAARVHTRACVELAKPECDQRRASSDTEEVT